jgi:hypothetical protein
MVFRCMTAANAVGFVMDVSRRMFWIYHEAVRFGGIEMKDSGFPVIDPDDSVIVRAGHG